MCPVVGDATIRSGWMRRHARCFFFAFFGASAPISSDSFAAITASRPAAACWYRIAAPGVEWPSRAISSASVAPVAAARTAPVWRRSWNRVRRGIVHTRAGTIEGTPKSDAGHRDVAVPPHLAAVLVDHLARFTPPGPDGLLFASRTGGTLPTVTLYRWYYPAREAAGRPDLRSACGSSGHDTWGIVGNSKDIRALLRPSVAPDTVCSVRSSEPVSAGQSKCPLVR